MESDGLTEAKFLKYFQMVIDLIKKLQESNKKTIDNIDARYSDKVDDIKKNYNGDITDIKKEAISFCLSEIKKLSNEYKRKINELDKKMAQIKDGKDADEENITEKASKRAVQALKPLIPTIDTIENDLPKLGAKIRDGLELLEGDDRLVIGAIQDLKEKLEDLERKIASKSVGFGGGGTNKAVYGYELSDRLDGTKTYVLPSMTKIIMILTSSYPGILRPTVDYNYNASTRTLTFTDEIDADVLSAGQTCRIIYSL